MYYKLAKVEIKVLSLVKVIFNIIVKYHDILDFFVSD